MQIENIKYRKLAMLIAFQMWFESYLKNTHHEIINQKLCSKIESDVNNMILRTAYMNIIPTIDVKVLHNFDKTSISIKLNYNNDFNVPVNIDLIDNSGYKIKIKDIINILSEHHLIDFNYLLIDRIISFMIVVISSNDEYEDINIQLLCNYNDLTDEEKIYYENDEFKNTLIKYFDSPEMFKLFEFKWDKTKIKINAKINYDKLERNNFVITPELSEWRM